MRIINNIFFTTLIMYCCSLVETRRLYESSYAYMVAKNEITRREQTFCVNFAQWLKQRIANDLSNAELLRLGWWGGIVNNTNVCLMNDTLHFNKQAVALNYRLERDDGPCANPFTTSNTSFKGVLQYEVNQLTSKNASAAIILVDKGRKFINKWADYLFSEFYDPDFNQSTKLPTFFMYKDVFFNELLDLSKDRSGSELSLQFYRPPGALLDLSMLIIWIIAMFCVSVGGYWAALRKLYEDETHALRMEDQYTATENQSKSRSFSNNERASTPLNCLFITAVMVVVVGILMLGFYFRVIIVYIFNILLAIIGTFSIHRCLTSLFWSTFKCGQCRVCVSINDLSRSIFHRDLFNWGFCSERPRLLSVIMFFFAASICIAWFIVRRDPYAFILLDFINIAVCVHVLKGIRFPNLKWLTILLICMFAYDIFMVFVTPFLTKTGCSVMIEVASGMDCSKLNTGYPVAPISIDIPEKFPMLFQIPRLNDPMITCIDLDIEKEFHPIILGLGDVIVPGKYFSIFSYLISFCFTVDFNVRTRYIYGISSIIGYGIGLIVTFIALTLMNTAQPALIYLIPFTILPVVIVAFTRGELSLLWTGKFPKSEILPQFSRGSETTGSGGGLNSISVGDNSSTTYTPANSDPEERTV